MTTTAQPLLRTYSTSSDASTRLLASSNVIGT